MERQEAAAVVVVVLEGAVLVESGAGVTAALVVAVACV
jgi:hypothetical protein